jgi:hypothetical protein
MTISTTVKSFVHGVTTALLDLPQFARWGEVEIIRYANYGQRAIAKYLPHVGARVDAIKLKPGTLQNLSRVLAADIIPGDGSTAADVSGIALIELIGNMGANGSTPGRVIRIADRYAKDSVDPDWPTRTGATVKEYLFEKNTPLNFEVSPGVTGNVWVRARWMVEPKAIPDGAAPGSEEYRFDGASTELLGIPDKYVEDLHNYVVAMCLLKGSKNVQNIPKAQYHAGLFTASINAQAAVVSGVSPNLKQLPFVNEIPGAA